MLNAAVFQLVGDDLADALHCDEYGELDVAISALMREAHHPTQGALATKGIYKASQATVQVKTPLGLSEERVPATCKQVRVESTRSACSGRTLMLRRETSYFEQGTRWSRSMTLRLRAL